MIAVLLRRQHNLTEVFEAGRPFGAHGAHVVPVSIDGNEPVETGCRALMLGCHVRCSRRLYHSRISLAA